MRWLVMLIIISLLFPGVSQAEKPKEAWVMCSPRGEVCVRSKPKRQAEEVGRVFSGDHIQLSGKRSGNWYHCYVACEDGQGWIRGDYLSFEEPEIYEGGKKYESTVDNLYTRESINGNKKGKINKGTEVTVYMTGDGWSVTSKGFIMAKFLEEVPE